MLFLNNKNTNFKCFSAVIGPKHPLRAASSWKYEQKAKDRRACWEDCIGGEECVGV